MGILNRNSRIYKLNNGLVVALQNNPQTETVSGVIKINFGIYQEKPDEEGLAHFLEHAVIAGGSEKFSPEETEYQIKSLGDFNPRTTLGQTTYPFSNLREDTEQTLDFFTNMIFKPAFDKQRVEGERGRILREILDRRSHPSYTRNRKFNKKLFRTSPKSLEGTGKIEDISLVTPNSLRALHQRAYTPTNTDIVIAGNLPRNIEGLIEQYFGGLIPGDDLRVKSYPALEPLQEKLIGHWLEPALYNPTHPEESSAQLQLMLVVPPETSPEFYALQILSYSLGECAHSRLMKSLGTEKGLAYQVSSDYNGTYDAGVFTINGKVPSVKLDEAIDTIFKELKLMKENPISKKDLEIFKKTFRLGLAKHFETNSGHVGALITKLETGHDPEYYLGGYSRLTLEEIRNVAQKYFPSSRNDETNYALAISDPLKK